MPRKTRPSIPTVKNFNEAAVHPKGRFIMINNFMHQHITPWYIATKNLPDMLESNITDEAFFTVIDAFAREYDEDILIFDEGCIIMTGGAETLRVLEKECGTRFSYMLMDGVLLKDFCQHQKKEQREKMLNEKSILQHKIEEKRPFVIVSNYSGSQKQQEGASLQADFPNCLWTLLTGDRVFFANADYAILTGGEKMLEFIQAEYGDHFSYRLAGEIEVIELIEIEGGKSLEDLLHQHKQAQYKTRASEPKLIPGPQLDS